MIDKVNTDKMSSPADSKVDDIMNTVLSLKDWSDEMRLFVMNNNENELVADPSKIYVMELETFEFKTQPKQLMSVLVSVECKQNRTI